MTEEYEENPITSTIEVEVPKSFILVMDRLTNAGYYSSQSDIVRQALIDLFFDKLDMDFFEIDPDTFAFDTSSFEDDEDI
ncbi:MAG: hypothetical protein ACFFE8_08470 [Candidatus Heimdallarchaeota archaeon]